MEHSAEDLFRMLESILETHKTFKHANKEVLLDILMDEDLPEMKVPPLDNELMDVFEHIYPNDMGMLLTIANKKNMVIYNFLIEIMGLFIYSHEPADFIKYFK